MMSMLKIESIYETIDTLYLISRIEMSILDSR